MIDSLFAICVVLASPPQHNSVEFQIVGVYRPVDLAGRVVNTPREVYLQSTIEGHDITPYVGATLDVLRRSPVPATVHMRERMDSEEAKPAQPEPKPAAKTETHVGRATRALKLKPSPKLSSVKDGKPAGFVSHPKAGKGRYPVYLGTDVPGGDRITPLRSASVKTEVIERAVGKIKVISVQGDVAIARVVNDGLDQDSKRSRSSVVPDEIPTVMAGDVARGEPRIPTGKRRQTRRKLSARSKAKLAEERRQVERAVKRRKMKPKPFIRKKMMWDL